MGRAGGVLRHAKSCLPAAGRVWDLRLGRSIVTLQGHVKAVLALDWAPSGYLLASGSEDHTCRIWDLRMRKCVYTLPCHQSLVSQVGALAACVLCGASCLHARRPWLHRATVSHTVWDSRGRTEQAR